MNKFINNPNSFWSFCWHHIKRYQLVLLLLLLACILQAAAQSIAPYLIKIIVDSALSLPSQPQVLSAVLILVGWYIVVTGCLRVLFRLKDYFKLKIYPSLKYSIVIDLHKYLLRHSYRYFKNNPITKIVSNVADLATGAQESVDFLIELITCGLAIGISALFFSFIGFKFTLIVVVWVLAFTLITLYFSKKQQVLSANYWHMRNITFTNMADTLTNILNVKIFNARDYEVQALKNNFAKDNLAEQAMLRLMLKLSVVQVSLVALLMIGLLGMLLVNFKNNVGDLVFVLLLASNIVKNVDELSVVLAKYTHVYAKCADAMKTIFVAHDIVDGDDAIVLNIPNGKIEFKNVSFQYDNVPHLFKNKSINIHAGAKVGLVGFSGAGKTSLLNLLVRLYDAQNGEIYIDNQNLKSVTIDSLRKNISLVPQNITLFNRSIYDNILYGKTSATPIEVYAAAKKALCDQFVLNLPDSYQTICQEHGIVLSASECQRIAIARAFLRDTKIILLDEPAVCMDLESEHVLQAALRDLYVNRTVIVVSNKMATLKELDRIIVFNNGKIVQDGTHEQLIKINGTYKDLYLS